MIVMVTGGARSGKSAFAEAYAERFGSEGIYLATAKPFDGEMERRISHHQMRRERSGFPWKTVEEPLRLPEGIEAHDFEYNIYRTGQTVLMVDCLTIWMSNVLLQWEDEDDAEERCMGRVAVLVTALRRFQGNLLLVTNEVGLGLVPSTKLGRLFRDISGRMNQQVASVCEQVVLVTAGIPIELKSRELKW